MDSNDYKIVGVCTLLERLSPKICRTMLTNFGRHDGFSALVSNQFQNLEKIRILGMNKRPNGENQKELGWRITEKRFTENISFWHS
jgi:DNA repair protein RadC